MAFFDDMGSAVRTYPDDNVTLEFIDIATSSGSPRLDFGETATFKVLITNRGVLDMNNVSIRLLAENGFTLQRPAGVLQQSGRIAETWIDELVSSSIEAIPANGGTATTETMTLKAPGVGVPPTPWSNEALVVASLHGWDAGFDHLLNAKSVARAGVRAFLLSSL
jgi:uncharacterized repeat protein (TIGR01451 family)